MSKAGALDLASGLGGQIDKGDVPSAVEKYEKYHVFYGGEEEARKANYTDLVNKYYDLVTSFYELGWGESFHFAPRWKNETLKESIKRHEHFLALQLALKPGQKVLDVGCGIGGPLHLCEKYLDSDGEDAYDTRKGKPDHGHAHHHHHHHHRRGHRHSHQHGGGCCSGEVKSAEVKSESKGNSSKFDAKGSAKT